MSLKPLTPPLRFSTVAFSGNDRASTSVLDAQVDDPRSHPHHRESVYRGAYPKPRNLYFLSRLHLRTVLSLTPRPLDNDAAISEWASAAAPESSSSSAAEKASQLGIRLVHVRCEKPKDESGGLTREGAARALSVLLDRRNHPIYVHCLDGVEVTSTLVACMRKVQAWSTPAILAELGRALRDSSSSEWTEVPAHLSSFLTKFGQPDGVRLPPRNHIPSWLWPAPNPLSVLADPYAWAPSSHHNGVSNANGSHDPSTAASNHASDAQMAKSPSYAPIPSAPSDGLAGSSAKAVPQQRGHASSRRERQLPIHHPTLKLHFDTDPDLPAEPSPPPVSVALSAASSSAHRPATPSRMLQAHSRNSSYNSIASLRTPPHSRPSSRAGRHPAANSVGSHPFASRSTSLAPEPAGSATRSASTARDASSASLLSPSPASAAAPSSDNQLSSVAALLEDQLLNDAVTSDDPSLNGSPMRPRHSDAVMASFADQPLSLHATASSSDAGSLSIETRPPLGAAHADDLDVSTPRARPTTSTNFNIGIAGTVFHHDDDITDHEGDLVSSIGRRTAAGYGGGMPGSRVVVPLEKRRQRAMDLEYDAEGEQTPTKPATANRQNATAHAGRTAMHLSARNSASDSDDPFIVPSDGLELRRSGASHTRDASALSSSPQHQVLRPHSDSTHHSLDEGKFHNETDQDSDDAQDATNAEQQETSDDEEDEDEDEEDEEEDEEEEEEEEEEEDDDDDDDDLALEALDLEGY